MASSGSRRSGAGAPRLEGKRRRGRPADIRALVCDVDGVLTRGDLIYGPDGGEWKVFNVQDGHGLVLARAAGLRVAWLTARRSPIVRRRARELKIDLLLEGRRDKAAGLARIAQKLGVPASAICYVGDDLLDLGALRAAGLPVAVANAVTEVKAAAAWTTRRRGGEGAVREVVERLLRAAGTWDDLVARSGAHP
jgi:3-deoxy-D-manno-octulosonate 8-phosphate phosphatase (KDO 8-P phosphatase)